MPGFPDYKSATKNITEPTEIYPDVNSSGFVEMKVSGRDYTDDLSKLDTIRQDSYYKKIPNDILKGSPKLENRYNINLEGIWIKILRLNTTFKKNLIFQVFTMSIFEKKQPSFNLVILIQLTNLVNM